MRLELLPRQWEFDPLAVKWLLQVEPPQLEDGRSDLDRLTRAVQQDWGKRPVDYSLLGLRDAGRHAARSQGQVTATIVRDSGRLHVINIEPGDTTLRHFAVAIDVGTTTIAVQLINLAVAQIVGRAERLQRPDRLRPGRHQPHQLRPQPRAPGGAAHPRARHHQPPDPPGGQKPRRGPGEISNAAVSGNTVMTHLLLGLNPGASRLAPYTPTVLQVPYLRNSEIGIEINPQAWIHFSPAVGSYVGGDITAGILCTDLATDTEDINLFIDIGTNGEIVLGNNSFLMACACSAGPAFEGGGIECGMRASTGAIEKVQVDPLTGVARYSTVGNVPPRGICGSGMIDLVAQSVPDRLDRSPPASSIALAPAPPSRSKAGARPTPSPRPPRAAPASRSWSREIDIENIIRTKASIYAACALMLNQVGLRFEDLRHIYIAGGFGRFLDLENATVIGLIPDLPRERFHYIGNSSLMGSYMVVVSQDYRQRQLELARRMTYLELNTDPAYMDQYTGALFLPHTDPARFPSVKPASLPARRT